MARFGTERSQTGEYPKNKEQFPFWSERIQKAYEIGSKAHEGQKRVTTGEPYFNHCVEVAGIIENWCFVKESRFVEDLVVAALLHDTVEDTDLTLEEIEREFGPEVAFLVDGVSKFKSEGIEGTDQETIKKVLEGYFVDPRVAILKLADRVQNMQSLKDMPEHKQGPKAKESEEVYARLAEALGMWKVMRDLKDAAFPIRFKERYLEVKSVLDKDPRRRPEYIAGSCNEILSIARETNVDCEVSYRLAGLRQIDQKRRKMQRPLGESGYEDVSEVLSIGVSVNSIDDCYRMLGVLRHRFGSLIDQSRSSDTISIPSDNGYQALREVVNMGFGAIELMIMTKEMEEFNNWGVISLIRAGIEDLSGFRMKIIFTPDNEIRVLPIVATGWDVAAALNTSLVLQLAGIKIDGEYDLPSTQIPHAAVVEIIASRYPVFEEDGSWVASLPSTRRIIEKGLERRRHGRVVEMGGIKAKYMLAIRGVLDLYDIRDEITPRLSEFGCRTIEELKFRIGGGEIDQKRLDRVLDSKVNPITKETLGLSTVLVRGKNEPKVLHRLTGIIGDLGGDIVRSVNRGKDEYEIRIVIKGLSNENEGKLRRILEESGRYKEVLVV